MEMQMELSYVFAVVITGLVVVFLGLLLLILFINIIGSVFKSMDKKKKNAKAAAAPSKPAAAPAVKAAEVYNEPAVSPEEDDDELIAVISAAVAMMSAAEGKNYRVKSVRAASENYGGNPWASAALSEATRPF